MPIVKVNLLPPRVKQARAQRLLITSGVAAGLLILSVPLGWWYLRWSTVNDLNTELRQVKAEAVGYESVIKRNEELKVQEAALEKNLKMIDKLVASQSRWIHVMEMLSSAQARARDLWLTSVSGSVLKGKDQGKIGLTVGGMTFSVASLDEFIQALRKSDLKPEVEPGFTLRAGAAGQSAFRFTATLKFKA